MSKTDRAKQFLPFNSLKGYYDLIREKEKEVTPKRELSEYDIEKINLKLNNIEKNMMVKIKYYDNIGYSEIEGIVSKIDYNLQFIVVVKTKINFKDIVQIY